MTDVQGAPRSRREEYADATRAALVDAGTGLFARQGYAGTSLEEVVAEARVTKGALYHHFKGGKKALFEAVLARQEDRARQVVAAALAADGASEADPWAATVTGLEAYLDHCLDPVYARVVLQDVVVALGRRPTAVVEAGETFGLLRGVLGLLVERGLLRDLPAATLARVLYGAMSAAAVRIAEAGTPEVRDEHAAVLRALLEGLRA